MAELNVNVRSAVMSELALRRTAAKRLREDRENYIEKNVSGYSKLTAEITKCGIALGRLALCGKQSEEYIKIQQKLDELIVEKQKLTEEYKDFLENVYRCNICKDTGFCEESGASIPCRCYRSILAEKMMESYGISSDNGTFEEFKIEYYSDDTIENVNGIDVSQRKIMGKVFKMCKNFADEYESGETDNMLFTGKTGVGKTFMCNSIAYELVKKGVPVLYMSAPSLLAKATMITSSDEQRMNQQEFCSLVRSVDVLIIDDLGTEKQSDTKYQELLEILNERIRGYGRGLRTVISTNLSPKDIYSYYDERIASRIIGEFKRIRFVGENIRMIKK